MNNNRIAKTAFIDDGVRVGNHVVIGENVIIKSGTILGDYVTIEDNVYIDYDVIIRDYVTIGENGTVGARCILGEYLSDFYCKNRNMEHPLIIGEHALIRSETIIYGDNQIGNYLQTGHRVTIREKSQIGNHVRIGTLSDIQGYCEIQDYVNLHSNVHVGQKSKIKKYAWIFPYVVLTNDPNPPSENLQGVTVEEFAIVSTGSVLLPGIVIGEGALIGAGAVVTKNVEDSVVAIGNPARVRCSTGEVRDNVTGEKVYPWQYTFDRGMPWEGIGYQKWIEETEKNEDHA